MKIAVVDGQGGGIGKTIIERLRDGSGVEAEIIALGTNALATSFMLKGGADEGASGENAIVFNAARVDIIVGTVGIITANSMHGEMTPAMTKAIGESPAVKVLIPLSRCNINIAGIRDLTLPEYIEDAVRLVKEKLNK